MSAKQLQMKWDTRYAKYTPELPTKKVSRDKDQQDMVFKKFFKIILVAIAIIILMVIGFSWLGELFFR